MEKSPGEKKKYLLQGCLQQQETGRKITSYMNTGTSMQKSTVQPLK